MNLRDIFERRRVCEETARSLMTKEGRTASDVEAANKLLDEARDWDHQFNVQRKLDELDSKEAGKEVTNTGDTFEVKSDSGITGLFFRGDVKVKRDGDMTDRLHIGHILRAALHGPKSEAERALLISGTGSYLVPEIVMNNVIDQLRADSIPGQVGAQFVKLEGPGDKFSFPRIVTDSTFEWKAENAESSPTTPVLDSVDLTPKTCRSLMSYSRELAQDGIGLPEALSLQFMGGLAEKINDAFLFGASNGPAGIEDLSGLTLIYDYSDSFTAQTVTTGSLFFPFLKCWGELVNAKVPMTTPLSIIINPEVYAELMGCIEATTGNPLSMPDVLKNCNWVVTGANTLTETPGARTSSIFIGQGSEAIVGIRNQLTVQTLDQLYASTYNIGALAGARLDIAHRHNASWAVIAGVNQGTAWS